jgi:3-hydroxyacyl-[acyl-carrier-protein] dehydratase
MKKIFDNIPHQPPFRFIDEISFADANAIEGHYTYRADALFYNGHFPGYPLTPGAILTETITQIGLVAFGIYLLQLDNPDWTRAIEVFPLLSSTNISFYKKVFPGETVFVRSEKIVFRHSKLRCRVVMKDAQQNVICEGAISGILGNL